MWTGLQPGQAARVGERGAHRVVQINGPLQVGCGAAAALQRRLAQLRYRVDAPPVEQIGPTRAAAVRNVLHTIHLPGQAL